MLRSVDFMNATLALEDGSWYRGVAAGASGETSGEVVFNTSMTGYQEVLTDPSYAGQIVTMTAPQIGNYGVAPGDAESQAPRVAGFVMREASPLASNYRADGTLRDYLTRHGIVAIADIDTRALTRVLRSAGVMRGVIATGQADPAELVEKARTIPKMEGADLVKDVTCEAPFWWHDHAPHAGEQDHREFGVVPGRQASRRLKVAAYDFGIKYNILRRLAVYGCDVHVFPASTAASDLLAIAPDGIFLSNGPGDPAALPYAVTNVRRLMDADVPMFGICLGHQIMGLAVGGQTYKLKFGHRGANHPVKALDSGKVEITSQNHGFAIDPDSLPADTSVTHLNLYDSTVEGFRHTTKPMFSVQYHPEASPGPHDADYLFRQFLESMEKR
jgi:carbamoyl-phosphate synthase small subunit